MPRPIRVLVIDDSATVRRIVRDILRRDRNIVIVGEAADPLEARDIIQRTPPDVLTLDLEMPKMDGLTFLRHVMRERPMPVIVMSSLTGSGSTFALEALRLGAVDVLRKPGNREELKQLESELAERIHIAAGARIRQSHSAPVAGPRLGREIAGPVPDARPHPRALILLGASTGGIEALRTVLTALPGGLPPIAIVQHIPAGFSRTFAERLDSESAPRVLEAHDGLRLQPGMVALAPGGFHLHLTHSAGSYQCQLSLAPPVWHQRPAVDVLFHSVARLGPANFVIAGVLTGMGQDGADGLLALRQAGARTFAQDEATSVVYGMPRCAWERGGAELQLPIEKVATCLQDPANRQIGTAANPVA